MSSATFEWLELDGGSFQMGNPRGDGYPQDGETPPHQVSLSPFAVAATTVTNDQFEQFVAETDYTTEAEEFGWSFVFCPRTLSRRAQSSAPNGGAKSTVPIGATQKARRAPLTSAAIIPSFR